MSVYGNSDRAILAELGRRIKRRRLQKNISQQKLGDMAGLSRIAIGNIERGSPFGVLALIQILRALQELDGIDALLPDPGISPLQLAKLKGKERRRASRQTAESGKRSADW